MVMTGAEYFTECAPIASDLTSEDGTAAKLDADGEATRTPIDPMSADAGQPTLEEPSTSDPEESTIPGSSGDPPT